MNNILLYIITVSAVFTFVALFIYNDKKQRNESKF